MLVFEYANNRAVTVFSDGAAFCVFTDKSYADPSAISQGGNMEKDIRRLNQLLLSGKCCAQALVALGLELKEDENPQLETAAAALCLGVRSGLICGALTGAAMMMNLFDPETAMSEMIPELTDWFRENYGERYQGIDCDSILEKNLANKAARCPALVENTYRKAREILEDYGVDWEEMAENLSGDE